MFRQDYTCPALLFVGHRFAFSCTGLSPAMAPVSEGFHYPVDYHVQALPISLATTIGISVDVFSSSY